MKIVILTDHLVMGGLETHIITTVNELLRRGHHVLLCSLSYAPEVSAQFDSTDGQLCLAARSGGWEEEAKRFEPEVIHAHPFQAITAGFSLAARLQRPLFVTVHGLYSYGVDRSPAGLKVTGYASQIIAVDHGVHDYLVKTTPHPEKVTVIYNGIDLKKFNPLALTAAKPALTDLDRNRFTVAAVGRLSDGKQWPAVQLLRCAPWIAERLSGLNVILLGDGVHRNEVEEYAREANHYAGVDVRLVGWKVDIRPYLAAADLVVACDRAAMEALACGKPVLAASAAGTVGILCSENLMPVLLHRSGYRLISDADFTDLVVSAARDPELLKQAALSGQAFVEKNFDSIQVTGQLENLYRMFCG